jgi:Asp-tRNA(Asn)/Glu-tRNA(Gln) amidotransferase A subunit family amidase
MPNGGGEPLYWPIAKLKAAYAAGSLSPSDVVARSFERLRAFDPELHAFICTLEPLATEQASAAVRSYREGTAGPLAGIPLSIKDTFDVAGAISTRGSLVYRSHVAATESGAVARLRAAGAVFIGKTNTAEFGQSATTDNRLGDDCRNPWDVRCTSGGSSGGAAASVAAGIVTAALGADGGGSLRIPGAFSGLVGFKPTFGVVADENGFPAMSEFCCAGPLTRSIADARLMFSVLSEHDMSRKAIKHRLRIAWCPRPDGRPVDGGVASTVTSAVNRLAKLGHQIDEVELPFSDWNEVFGPLVLEEEGRVRGHLLHSDREKLTDYELATLEAAAALPVDAVEAARVRKREFISRADEFFRDFDLIITPTTATTAFPVGRRPETIAGEKVGSLWGAFPFTAAFNVAGTPAVTIPCGLSSDLPVGLQIVGARGEDVQLLDIAEDFEEELAFDMSPLSGRFAFQQSTETVI